MVKTLGVVACALALIETAAADPKPRVPAPAASPMPRFDVRSTMSAADLKRTGLSKLSDDEAAALNSYILDLLVRLTSKQSIRGNGGVVRAASNDETFVIELSSGNAVFKARTYCFGVDEDDEVVFTKSPTVCTSNTFVVKGKDKTCDVWCE